MVSETTSPELASLPEHHRNAIVGLAADTRCPLDLVVSTYRNELNELQAGARVTQFLPVIVSRRAREKLQSRRKV